MHPGQRRFLQGGLLLGAAILVALNANLPEADAQNVDIKAKEKDSENFSLTKIDGRHWLLTPDGRPFFAHGITHAGNRNAKLNFPKFSEACKELGFNAYGYGCPTQLRSDMPYVASWNHRTQQQQPRHQQTSATAATSATTASTAAASRAAAATSATAATASATASSSSTCLMPRWKPVWRPA